jgi:LPXTG-motif cell wall-anchored protein
VLKSILQGLFAAIQRFALAILPEGTVRDETTFLVLLAALAGLIGLAIYLRLRKKN